MPGRHETRQAADLLPGPETGRPGLPKALGKALLHSRAPPEAPSRILDFRLRLAAAKRPSTR